MYRIGRWPLSVDAALLGALCPQSDFPELELFRTVAPDTLPPLFEWRFGPSPQDEPDRTPAFQTEAVGAGERYLRVCSLQEGWLLKYALDWKHIRAGLRISPGYHSAEVSAGPALPDSYRQRLFSELGNLFAYSVIPRGGLTLHAVAMRWRGKAVLLCAASGTGKTTHAHLWLRAGEAEVINGDRALCGMENGIWTVYGQPWCGSSAECLNQSAPIGAVVLLERGERNQAQRLAPFEAALGLMPRIFAPPWDAALTDTALGHLDSLAASVPFYRLQCRPDAEAVETLKAALKPLFPQGGNSG